MLFKKIAFMYIVVSGLSVQTSAATLLNGDHLIKGQLCIGEECNQSDDFGEASLELKRINNRIDFLDSSPANGNFPSNNWRLKANDETFFGKSYFSIIDLTHDTTPFRIDADAKNNAFVINKNGSVGIGTNNPAEYNELEIASSSIPSIVLVQTDDTDAPPLSSWEMLGHQDNFAIRNQLKASSVPPFIITPNANSYSINSTEDGVGINTYEVHASFHVKRLATSEEPEVALFESDGDSRLILVDTANQHQWEIGTDSRLKSNFFSVINADNRNIGMALFDDGSFQVGNYQDGRADLILTTNGDLNIQGTVIESSSKSVKENFIDVDVQDVLNKVVALKISRWNYITDDSKKQHIGPMAEDFYDAFSVGSDPTHVSTVDKDGVALASIQALNAKVNVKDQEIQQLKLEVMQLKGMLSQILELQTADKK